MVFEDCSAIIGAVYLGPICYLIDLRAQSLPVSCPTSMTVGPATEIITCMHIHSSVSEEYQTRRKWMAITRSHLNEKIDGY